MIKERTTKPLFLFLGILLFLVFLVVYINITYPYIGHDYRYFLPHFLDTYLHYLNDGFSIQWFSPSFGGGLPAYFHPQHMQFSLQQILIFMMNPWVATMVVICIYSIIGYGMCYLFLREVIEVHWQAGILGSLFFISTGFFIQHSTSGTGYEGYPLIALIMYLLFSAKISRLQGGILIGFVLTIWIFSAGFYLFVILGLSILLTISLVYFLVPEKVEFGKLANKGLLAAAVFVLLAIGKLYAVFSFMQNFPREVDPNYYSSSFVALVGIVVQFTGVPLFTIPLRVLRGNPSAVGEMMTALTGGQQLGIWEMDVSISPVLLYILFFQIRKIPGKIKNNWGKKPLLSHWSKEKSLALVLLIFSGWICISFTSARGLLYELSQNFPVLSSMHNNLRFATAFVFPLSIIGAIYFDYELPKLGSDRRIWAFVFFFFATLVSLGNYFLLSPDLQSRNYNLTQTLKDYHNIKDGKEFFVSDVFDITDYWVFNNHATSLRPYEPIFGYDLEEFSSNLVQGSIYLVEDGHFNMTNPRSLVYDSNELFSRFSIEEREMMEEFAHYRQPDWGIPNLQHILNRISGLTFLIILSYSFILLGKVFLGFIAKNFS